MLLLGFSASSHLSLTDPLSQMHGECVATLEGAEPGPPQPVALRYGRPADLYARLVPVFRVNTLDDAKLTVRVTAHARPRRVRTSLLGSLVPRAARAWRTG